MTWAGRRPWSWCSVQRQTDPIASDVITRRHTHRSPQQAHGFDASGSEWQRRGFSSRPWNRCLSCPSATFQAQRSVSPTQETQYAHPRPPARLLACPLALALGLPLTACSTDDSQAVSQNADDPRSDPQPQTEEPETLPITQTDADTDIDDIPSDPFQLGEVKIEGDTLLVTVSYAGGAAEHDFALYWNGITARSYPGQIHVQLRHDANGDTAEAYLTQTLRFDLSGMVQPLIIHVHGHGEDDRATVQYGERE